MASLVIKNLPDKIHKVLKAKAKEHHRSMTQEAIAVLESIYDPRPLPQVYTVADLPAPFRPRKPITNAMIQKAKREGML